MPETSPPSQVPKIQTLGAVWYDREGWVQRERGVGVTRFESKHRIEAVGLLVSGVDRGAISSEGRDGRGAYTRDRLNKVPPGLRGGR